MNKPAGFAIIGIPSYNQNIIHIRHGKIPDPNWQHKLPDGRIVKWDGDNITNAHIVEVNVGVDEGGEPITETHWYIDGTEDRVIPMYMWGPIFVAGRLEWKEMNFTATEKPETLISKHIFPWIGMPQKFDHKQDGIKYLGITLLSYQFDDSTKQGSGLFIFDTCNKI
jgi:hypothetical protein